MKKIAMIVQGYGLEVNGGAEYHCRLLAEKINPLAELEVLTTCAVSYNTWGNEYPEGLTDVNGVQVRRFKTLQNRDKATSRRLSKILGKKSVWQKILKALGLLSGVERLFRVETDLEKSSYELAKSQGPYAPDLIAYLEEHHKNYDVLVFFTYLYFPTIYGLRIAPEKSVLIPTAHDESAIYLPVYTTVFNLPRAILYNSKAEKRFVNRLFNNETVYSDIVGVGIDQTDYSLTPSSSSILQSNDRYLLYIGRIDKAKGCLLMIQYFLRYKKSNPGQLKLVLIGKANMTIPESDDIISLGFVAEDIKQRILKDAAALVIPSFYESLSMVTLESMQEGIPVIANSRSEVLSDHIKDSGGGLTFSDFQSFKMAIDAIVGDKLDLSLMKANAVRYVKEKYNWETVLQKFTKAIAYVTQENP